MTEPKKKRYRATEKGKATEKAYAQSPRAKALRKAMFARNTPEQRTRKNGQSRRWRQTEEGKAYLTAYARLKNTGVSLQMFNDLMALQRGRCAVCGGPLLPGRGTHADHCHTKKKPRGLLCHYCNVIEGLIVKVGIPADQYGVLLQRYLDDPPADILELA